MRFPFSIILWVSLSAVLNFMANPPYDLGELAYFSWVPWLLWHSRLKCSHRLILTTACTISLLHWLATLVWLRHVTVLGWLTLSTFVSIFWVIWLFFTAKWVQDWFFLRPLQKGLRFTLIISLFVSLEWLRNYIFTGFPWLPLATSQWKRPVLLQLAEFTGYWGVSAWLVFLNLALFAYAFHIWNHAKGIRDQRFCLSFYIALSSLLIAIVIYAQRYQKAKDTEQYIGKVAVVQPYIPSLLKWDSKQSSSILTILSRQTTLATYLEPKPDLILWPEAATPYPAFGHPPTSSWIKQIAYQHQIPLLSGNLADTDTGWYNTILMVDPVTGIDPAFYAKRKLVPFGEYVPLRQWFSWLGKIVPFQDDFQSSKGVQNQSFNLKSVQYSIGGLICYEDIFPHLARESVLHGADWFFVCTNNAWYGEEAGAFQHAAHSVLRAVETRRPIVRCGNGGWSGWIDALGNIRHQVIDDRGSIYFRGVDAFTITYNQYWKDSQTFYVRYGDWFPVINVLFLGIYMIIKNGRRIFSA